MAGPLLYRPPPRWQVWAALAGAVAVHGAAVAIASIHPKEVIEDLSQIPEAVVELSLEQQQAAAADAASGGRTATATAAGAIPEQKPEFVEEKPTPPPKRPPSTKPVAPIARPVTAGPSGPCANRQGGDDFQAAHPVPL